MRRCRLAVALGVVGALGACSGGNDNGSVLTSDSAGVRIVRNLQPARDTLRTAAPEVRIGHDETQTESVFREVHDVAFTPGGGIVVVDGGNRVMLFDSAGRSPRLLGRSGQGPGEYRGVRWALVRGDTIALWDVESGRELRTLFRSSARRRCCRT